MSEERDIVERSRVTAYRLAGFDGPEKLDAEIVGELLLENASEIQRLRGEVERLTDALAKIADGSTPPQPEGHYLAHRHAVKLAREALSPPSPKAP
jgi:hypothetical protein